MTLSAPDYSEHVTSTLGTEGQICQPTSLARDKAVLRCALSSLPGNGKPWKAM